MFLLGHFNSTIAFLPNSSKCDSREYEERAEAIHVREKPPKSSSPSKPFKRLCDNIGHGGIRVNLERKLL